MGCKEQLVEENGYFRIQRGQLRIGENGQAIQLMPGSSTQQDSSNISTCTETPRSNPESDEMIMSAIAVVEQQLLAMNMLPCNNGATATDLFVNLLSL